MQYQANSDKILFLLKTRGAMTAKALAANLQMTAMGARQHLLQLQKEELVDSYSLAEKVGRPSQYWQLTEHAQSRFPDAHSQLTISMLDAVQTVFGEQGVDTLIQQREQDSLTEYLQQLQPLQTLQAKVQKLTQIRNAEGYMATCEQDQYGNIWLYENHCPICAAAKHCQGFCRSELNLFKACLKGVAAISREQHMLDGARRCAYKIAPI